MSTLYTLPYYAKKTCTGLLCALGLLFFSTMAFGQTADLQAEVGNLSGKTWKSGSSLTATIAEERATAQAIMAFPQTHPDDVAIQAFYVAVLDQFEVRVQSGTQVSDALLKAFDETTANAVNNAPIKTVAPETVFPLMHTLVERLQEVPVFVPASN